MNYQDLYLDKLIAITHPLDFTKMKGRYSAEYVRQGCNLNMTMDAIIREGNDSTAQKRRRAIRRYATTAMEEQQQPIIVQDMTMAEFEANKVCAGSGLRQRLSQFVVTAVTST